jgi:hypothetical protein
VGTEILCGKGSLKNALTLDKACVLYDEKQQGCREKPTSNLRSDADKLSAAAVTIITDN